MFFDDKSSKLYVGSFIKGLKVFSLLNFFVSQKNIPYQNDVSYAAVPFSDSSVVTREGIEYFKDKTRHIFPNYSFYTKYLFFDDRKNLICINNNSIQIKLKNSYYKKYDSVYFKNKKIEGIFKTGGLYIASTVDAKNWSINVLNPNDFKKTEKSIPIRSNINTVFSLSTDLLYAGCGDGIYIVSLSKGKILKKLRENIPVKQILRTKDGNIWVTTYNKGFFLLRADKMIKMPYDRSEYLSSAHCIVEDEQGNYWIPTNKGLFRVKKKMLLSYADSKNNKVIYYRYSKENGLLNNEFNGGAYSCFNELNDGQFVFPSMEGFVFFEPRKVKTYFPRPEDVFLERIKTEDNASGYIGNHIQLKSNYKSTDIYIDIPYYSDFDNLHLQVMLENGSHEEWQDVKNDRIFTLNEKDPGDYILVVRFLVSENGNFVYKRLPIVIEPQFYQTIFFKVFIIFITIGIVILLIQMRTNFLKIKLEQTNSTLELTRNELKDKSDYQKKLIESISHDITTPVKFIAQISQDLHHSTDTKIQKKYFNSIYRASEELYKFTLSLKEYTELYKLDVADHEEHDIYDLVENKRELFIQIAEKKNTSIRNTCQRGLLLKTNKNIILAIVHNILDNAVKNTENGSIIISAYERENGKIEISFEDSGSGMSTEQIQYYSELFKNMESGNSMFRNYGLGLHMVLQLITKIKAEIVFQSNKPSGTIVKILIGRI